MANKKNYQKHNLTSRVFSVLTSFTSLLSTFIRDIFNKNTYQLVE